MKITIEVDCTPEEARRALGLPDLTPLHERFVASMGTMLDGTGPTPEMAEALVRSWAPMEEAGLTLWRQMFERAAKPPA